MKKRKIIAIAVVLLVVICGSMIGIYEVNNYNSKAHLDNLKLVEVSSKIYDKNEIDSCKDIVINEFKENWHGYSLDKLYYAGDEWIHDPKRYRKEEILVLKSDIRVGPFINDGNFASGNTLEQFTWTLGRNKGEAWMIVDGGY